MAVWRRSLEDMAVDAELWAGRRVLVTGHTGFKGAWLTLWLGTLGAEVTGFSADVPTRPSLFGLARVGEGVRSITGDVRSFDAVRAAVAEARRVLPLPLPPLVPTRQARTVRERENPAVAGLSGDSSGWTRTTDLTIMSGAL